MLGRLPAAGAVAVIALMALATTAAPAFAHVALLSSTPSDRARLSVVPTNIELVFNSEMQPSGPGIVLSDAIGTTHGARVTQPAKHRLVVEPEHPLDDGSYRLSWTVRAGDAHPISGTVAFVVSTSTSNAGTVTLPSPSTSEEQQVHGGGHVGAAPHGGDVKHLNSAEWLGRGARWLALLGALLGIGVLAFAATSLTGTVVEVRAAAFWVRRSGLAVALGTLIELGATSSLLHGAWGMGLAPRGLGPALSGPFGMAILLRVVGGGAMLFGAQVAVTPLLDSASGGFAGEMLSKPFHGTVLKTQLAPPTHRLNVGRSKIALAGAGVVALSYLFDGHTVTAEPAWLVRIADVAHVFGAGVWVGGVAMMAWVLKHRHENNVALRAGDLAVRFSTVAAGALAVVAVAGSALTISILDLPGELFSTAFGRLLLLKMLAVAAAGAIGAYNHRVVVPELARSPTDALASEKLRAAVRVETAILIAVVGLTAVLVGAAS